MDIQKEKKAIKNLKAFYMEDWNLTEEERDDLDNLVSRIVAVVKTEAQAVPEGFVLMPKEPTEKMNKAGLQEYRKVIGVGQDDIGYIYKAMIEAQEPAND
ncbi:MAG: hypothetical protein L0G67_04720 [Acinetobacter sp.]|jgi:hypothetical protein|nr:hypothetical protein [Acinetobacter sp.]